MPPTLHVELTPRPEDEARRALDILTMHRLARRGDGGAALLAWLGHRATSWAGLVDPSGAVLVAPTRPPVDPALLAHGLAEMRERGLAAFVVEGAPRECIALLAVDAGAGAQNPVLAAVASGPPATLLSDAADLLATAWARLQARRTAARVQLTEARCREAVLHLLMGQHLGTARQLASALSPALPEVTRVHVIEIESGRRGEVISRCAELTEGDAWIVRCPVYSRHVIVLAPGTDDPTSAPLERAISAAVDGCAVGAGEAVALRDTAVGYEQAFHALAVARGRAERWARFDATLELAVVVGAAGRSWADRLLAALAGHVPARATDPDAEDLTMTARSWLSFSTAASRHLGIHRNTLALRLKRIEELLGMDLGRPDQQAALDLALRIRNAPTPAAGPPEGGPPPGFDDLLRLPGARRWADAALRPVRGSAQLESTLRAWVTCGGRLSDTCEALQLSAAGTRKRLERLEQVLGRSLLHSPTARHDLWLAVRAAALEGPAPDDHR